MEKYFTQQRLQIAVTQGDLERVKAIVAHAEASLSLAGISCLDGVICLQTALKYSNIEMADYLFETFNLANGISDIDSMLINICEGELFKEGLKWYHRKFGHLDLECSIDAKIAFEHVCRTGDIEFIKWFGTHYNIKPVEVRAAVQKIERSGPSQPNQLDACLSRISRRMDDELIHLSQEDEDKFTKLRWKEVERTSRDCYNSKGLIDRFELTREDARCEYARREEPVLTMADVCPELGQNRRRRGKYANRPHKK